MPCWRLRYDWRHWMSKTLCSHLDRLIVQSLTFTLSSVLFVDLNSRYIKSLFSLYWLKTYFSCIRSDVKRPTAAQTIGHRKRSFWLFFQFIKLFNRSTNISWGSRVGQILRTVRSRDHDFIRDLRVPIATLFNRSRDLIRCRGFFTAVYQKRLFVFSSTQPPSVIHELIDRVFVTKVLI